MHDVRRVLWSALLVTVSLPIVLAVVLGLGFLLEALGDEIGWVWCRRLALVLGAAWAVAIAGTTVCSAILSLAEPSHSQSVGTPTARRGHEDDRPPG